MDAKRPAFGIFEGGGAKGIAHIGALEGAAKNGLAFVGVAGASAGAIVATLVAAGYSASTLMNPDIRDQNILSLHNLTPVTLLGADDWRRFVRLRQGLRWALSATALGGVLLSFLTAPLVTFGMLRIWRHLGFFTTTPIREFINTVLRERMRELYAANGRDHDGVPDRIRFADLNYEEFNELSPLKIVATEINSGSLMVSCRIVRKKEVVQPALRDCALSKKRWGRSARFRCSRPSSPKPDCPPASIARRVGRRA